MDENLTFKNHMDTVNLNINRANCLLARLRYYINPTLLRTIYYAIFEPHLWYGCRLWGQTQTQVLQNIEKIQSKALRIVNFKSPWEPSEQIHKEFKMFKLKDIVTISNLKFVYDQLNKILPRVFENFFLNKTRQHLYNTRGNSSDVSASGNNDLWFQLIHITCNSYIEFFSKQTQHHYIAPHLNPH